MTRFWTFLAAALLAVPAHAVELGDDGLHKAEWMRDTFKDLQEDLAEANAEGKRMAIIFEQRGCVYCEKMHQEVFPQPVLHDYITENYFIIQMDLYGATEITDFDGEALAEKDAARKWGILFTPTILFLDDQVAEGETAQDATVSMIPGAFALGTTLDMFTWVNEKRYELDNGEDFQRYHARMIRERDDGFTD